MPANLPILVAYDGSAPAQHALSWAAEEAAGTGAAVRVVLIDEVATSRWGGDVWVSDPEILVRAEKLLVEAGIRDHAVERYSGHVVGELLRMGESARLLVVGSRGHGRMDQALLGSVSQHLAQHATCSVVVVREPHTEASRRLIVGLDGSPASSLALDFACRRAERTHEEVVALHGWRVQTPSTDVWSSTPRASDEAVDREVLVAESVAGVSADHPDVELRQETIPVSPRQALVDASANASLVVVGSRGLGFFSGLLLGSVSRDVVQRARCSVAVIR